MILVYINEIVHQYIIQSSYESILYILIIFSVLYYSRNAVVKYEPKII